MRVGPDVTIDCFCNPRTAIWTFASGARARSGYPNKGWRSALYTHHAAAALSATTASISRASRRSAGPCPPNRRRRGCTCRSRRSARRATDCARWACRSARRSSAFTPARWPTRCWPVEALRRAREAGARVAARRGRAVHRRPGREEAARACVAQLASPRAFVVSGWPIARFVALQSLCAAFVSGDTGPLHVGRERRARWDSRAATVPRCSFPYPEREGTARTTRASNAALPPRRLRRPALPRPAHGGRRVEAALTRWSAAATSRGSASFTRPLHRRGCRDWNSASTTIRSGSRR